MEAPPAKQRRGPVSERRIAGESSGPLLPRYLQLPGDHGPGPAAVPRRPLKAHHVAELPAPVRRRCPGCACALPRGGIWDPRKGAGRGRDFTGWAAVGGVSSLCKSHRRARARGGACDAKPGPPVEARGGGSRNPRPPSGVADVTDVAFKSGRAGAVSRNANLGCYTTAGVCCRRQPGSSQPRRRCRRLSRSGSLRPSPPPFTRVSGSLPEPPSTRTGRPRPSASPRRPSPPAALAASAVPGVSGPPRRRLPASLGASGSPVRPNRPAATVCDSSAPLAFCRARRSGRHEWGPSPQRFPGTARPARAPGPAPTLHDPRRRPRPRPGRRFDRPEPPARGGRPEEIGFPGPGRKAPSYSLGGLAGPLGRSRGPLIPGGTGWARPPAARARPPPAG